MSADKIYSTRISQVVSTLLLSLVVAYSASAAALVLVSATSTRSAAAAVASTLAVTLVGCMAAFLRGPKEVRRDRDPEPPRNRGGPAVTALLLAAALTVSFLTTYPNLSDIGSLILGDTGDSGLYIYLLEWQLHAAFQDPGSYFEPNIFAPEASTLVWGPVLLPLVPAYGLLKVVTGNPIEAFNLLMVAVTCATLAATYIFLRYAEFSRSLSGMGALLFATTAQRMSHLGHLDSFQTLWIPVFGVLMLRLWENFRPKYGLLLGLALGSSLLAAPYYFLAGLGFVGTMVIIHLASWRTMPGRGLLAAGGTTLLVGGPILVLSSLSELRRSAEEIFPLTWADFYHPGHLTPAISWLASAAGAAGGGTTNENWLFPSVALTLLGSLGALHWLRSASRGDWPLPENHPPALPSLLAAAAISGVVLAVGPYLSIGSLRLLLPMAAIVKLPGFDNIRVTGRFIVPTFLALTVLAVIGLRAVLPRMGIVSGRLLLVAIAIMSMVSTRTDYPLTRLDVSGPATEVNRELATLPRGLVVELPWSACPGYGCLYTEPPRMIWSRYDWFPRLGGYSGHIPAYWADATESLAGFPDQGSLKFLDEYGARYVLLRVSAGDQGAHFTPEQAAAIAFQARQLPEVTNVKKVKNDYLLTLY